MQGLVSYTEREPLPGLISALFNDSAEGWVIVDRRSKQVTWANNAALQLFETNAIEELAVLVRAAGNGEAHSGEGMNRAMTGTQSQGVYSNDTPYRGKTGRAIWARASSRFEYNGNQYVLLQFADTSSYRGRREDAELKEALAVQRLVFENSGAMMVLAGADYVIRQVNPMLESKMGYRAEDLVGKRKIAFLLGTEALPGQTGAAGITLYQSFLGETIGEGPLQEEFSFKRKSGDELPVSVTVSLLHNTAGALMGFLVLALDMSLHKAIEEELQRSLQQERKLSELKSRFVSVASHEFRTPLSTILSSVYLMQHYTRTEEQPQREKHIRRIEGSVSLLNDILDDFLSVEKIEEGKVSAKCTEFNADDLVQSVLEELQPILKTGQQFNYSHSGESSVILDPLLLRHILVNLLSNAIKFSGEHQEITITTTVTTIAFTLVIKDHGIGISAEDTRHLFQRFFRASNAAHIKGTGLGLHIVKKYAELMKGTISIKSEPGRGTEVLLCFNR